MSTKRTPRLVTGRILADAVTGAFTKLDPRILVRNPVMFVVAVVTAFVTLLSHAIS